MLLPAALREFENLSPQQWIERASRTLPRGIMVLVIIAIAWQLVQLTWMILDQRSEAAVIQPSAAPQMMMPQPNRGTDIQAVIAAHLFGIPNATPEPSPEDAPPIQANLSLTGLWTDDDPKRGYAMIGEAGAPGKTYAVGATIRPGTTLYAVYADKAILDTGGKLESLVLPRTSTPEVPVAAPQVPIGSTAGGQVADNLRRIAESNPTAFAELIRPQAVLANGMQRGYRVFPGRNVQQFAKLGLKPGDLITSINGTPLDDPQRGMEIFNTLGASDQVNVSLERDGQMRELTLNMGQLSLPGDSAAPRTPPLPPGGVVAPLE